MGGSDTGEFFPGDLIKGWNRNGRNNCTSAQGSIWDMRDPDKTETRVLWGFPESYHAWIVSVLDKHYAGFKEQLKNKPGIPGIDDFTYEFKLAADDDYPYNNLW